MELNRNKKSKKVVNSYEKSKFSSVSALDVEDLYSKYELNCAESLDLTDEEDQLDFSERTYEFCGFNLDENFTHMLSAEVQGLVVLTTCMEYFQMRNEVINWVTREAHKFLLKRTVLHAAIRYLDRILCEGKTSPYSMELLCYSCLLLAAKYGEADANIPKISLLLNDSKYLDANSMIKETEIFIMSKLNWKLNILSPIDFLENFLARGCLFKDDDFFGRNPPSDLIETYIEYMENLSDLCLREYYCFQEYLPSHLAASIVSVCRDLLGISPKWRPELEKLTGYPECAIWPCYNRIMKLFSHFFSTFSTKPSLELSPTSVSGL